MLSSTAVDGDTYLTVESNDEHECQGEMQDLFSLDDLKSTLSSQSSKYGDNLMTFLSK